MPKKTKLEIIEETVAAYNTETRAIEDGDCCYETSDGKHCAVGRCMTKAALKKYGGIFGSVNQLAADSGEKGLQSVLSPAYRGHDITFWMDLQGLHDLPIYWGKNGISGLGNIEVKRLKKKHKIA